jgi:hypothetical protein
MMIFESTVIKYIFLNLMDLTGLPKKLFIVIVLIACFTCYARPDYNLPLFAFAYLLWDIEPVWIRVLFPNSNKKRD